MNRNFSVKLLPQIERWNSNVVQLQIKRDSKNKKIIISIGSKQKPEKIGKKISGVTLV